jgi:hypothetical protein
METLQMYYQCWLKVTKQKWYQDKWLTDETYYRAIKAQFSTVVSLGFERGKMNQEILSHCGTTLDDFTVLVDFIMKQVATIPLAIPRGKYGDTPPDDKKVKTIGDHYSVICCIGK